jgi:hypothetical protein
MLSAAGVFWGLPEPLSLGPGWLLLAVILVLMIPIVITNSRGYFKITRMLTFTALALITVAMIASLIFLIQGIPSHREMPNRLRKNGLRDLDSLQSQCCDSGSVLAASAGVPRIHFRACEQTATWAYVACIARFLIRTKL